MVSRLLARQRRPSVQLVPDQLAHARSLSAKRFRGHIGETNVRGAYHDFAEATCAQNIMNLVVLLLLERRGLREEGLLEV